MGVLALRDRSVSISSSRGEVLRVGDLRVGHIVDPRSGEPVPGARLAVVAAPTGTGAEDLPAADAPKRGRLASC